MSSINDIIAAIRDSFPDAEKVYLSGSCYRFYLILKTIDPSARPFYNGNHVVTNLYGSIWDITGRIKSSHMWVNGIETFKPDDGTLPYMELNAFGDDIEKGLKKCLYDG